MRQTPGWVQLSAWETAVLLAFPCLLCVIRIMDDSPRHSLAAGLPFNPRQGVAAGPADLLIAAVLAVLLGVTAMTALALALFLDRWRPQVPEALFPVRGRWVRRLLCGTVALLMAFGFLALLRTAGITAVFRAVGIWALLMAPIATTAWIQRVQRAT